MQVVCKVHECIRVVCSAYLFCISALFHLCIPMCILSQKAKEFYSLGVYTAMSVVQGGNGFPFLADCVYEYLVSGVSTGIRIPMDKVPDPSLRFALEKVF